MTDKYVFLDRDGVINTDGAGRTETGYITKWEDFKFIPKVLEGIKIFTESGYKCVIISNQQCVGKGYLTEENLIDMTNTMVDAVRDAGGDIEDFFYCTHLDEDNCNCRKPKSGLFLMAKEKLGIKDFTGKYFLGDSERDIEAGKSVGLGTILILSGKTNEEDVKSWQTKPDHIFNDLVEAARFITRNEK